MHHTIPPTNTECIVFGFLADGRAFCHSHDGPVAAAAGVLFFVLFLCFICHTYTNFPVLLFQIKIRITPVVRALHTQNKKERERKKTQQYQELLCSR